MSVALRVRAYAKINLTLRVLGVRPDGYHSLRTIFQSIALHDTLDIRVVRGPFSLTSNDPMCPTDRSNLVCEAADRVWRAAGRRGRACDIAVHLFKRIPVQAGLGGGSSDAAAALRAFASLWSVRPESLLEIARALGADVPFFLVGGTALGLERGDLLFPIAECPPSWVTLVIPTIGVSTADAFRWFDDATDRKTARRSRGVSVGAPGQPPGRSVGRWPWDAMPSAEFHNDLQPTVERHRPEIRRFVTALRRRGAWHVAMSGSGSAVFALFEGKGAAEAAARVLGHEPNRAIVTRTIPRRTALASPRPR
jgi:4-diphosphocytidyl-2-C-methyl-D-erythritol kinase